MALGFSWNDGQHQPTVEGGIFRRVFVSMVDETIGCFVEEQWFFVFSLRVAAGR